MQTRSGSNKVNFRELARELNISAMTLYRVVNNVSSVRPETRKRVIAALHRHGFYSLRHTGRIRILFDFSENEFQQHYGMSLMQRLSARDYSCVVTDHRKNPARFRDAAAEGDILVFYSIPEAETIEEVRKINPELYTICLYTRCGADITISADNTLGGELAAEHLHRMGHRHIAVNLALGHPTRMERFQSFLGRMKLLDPDCRIDPVAEQPETGMCGTLLCYLESVRPRPTALFFPAGGFAQTFYEEVIARDAARFGDLSIMSYDRPCDFWPPRENVHEFDRIEFRSEDLLDWTEYYILNRPMMEPRTPIHTCIRTTLKIVGSVKDITGKDAAAVL